MSVPTSLQGRKHSIRCRRLYGRGLGVRSEAGMVAALLGWWFSIQPLLTRFHDFFRAVVRDSSSRALPERDIWRHGGKDHRTRLPPQ